MTRPLDLGIIEIEDLANADLDERWSSGIDAMVFMNPDASETEIASAERAIRAIPGATIVEFVDQYQSWIEFQESFAGSAQVRSSIQLADMPSSFRIELAPSQPRDARNEFVGTTEVLPGVFEVVAAPWLELSPVEVVGVTLSDLVLETRLRPRLVVFLNPGATPGELAEIEAEIGATGARMSVYSQAQALEEAQMMFADSVAFRDLEEMDMPASVRAEYAPGLMALADKMQELPHVFDVTTPEQVSLSNEVQRRLIDRLLRTEAAGAALTQALDAAESDQGETLKSLAPVLDEEDPGTSYQRASALREGLARDCGAEIYLNFSNAGRPLIRLVNEMVRPGS